MKKFAALMSIIILFLSLMPIAHANAANTTGTTSVDAEMLTNSAGVQTDIDGTVGTNELIDELLAGDIAISLLVSNTSTEIMYQHLVTFDPILQELENRDDTTAVLVEKYVSLLQLANSNDSSNEINILSLSVLKILLDQPIYHNSLTDEQITQIDFATTSLGIGNSTNNLGTASPNSAIDDLRYQIDISSIEYVDADITVKTLDGENVILSVAQSELASSSITYIRNSMTENFPNVSEIGNPTAKYNCHSYAWYQQSPTNKYWLDDCTPYTYDSHNTQLKTPTVGSICVYFDSNGTPVHSGIIIAVSSSNNFTVRSKWGKWGLYEHAYDDVPPGYTYDCTNLNCRYFKRSTAHTFSSYSKYSSTQHKGTCTICSQVIYSTHVYSTPTYDSSYHYMTCKSCGYSTSSAHVINSTTGKCTSCNYSGLIISPTKLVLSYTINS